MVRIGLQSMMLKDSVTEIGAFDAFRKANDIGYSVFEISQIPLTPQTVAELGRARAELGIDIAAISAHLTPSPGLRRDALTTDMTKIISDAHDLGAQTVRIAILPFSAMESKESLLRFADQANEMARVLGGEGIDLCYHNHHIDFALFDGVTQLDVIADRAPLLKFEIDVHWAYRGGVDPVALIEKYGSRARLVHLRDYRVDRVPAERFTLAASAQPPSLKALMGDLIHDAEVGEGILDMAGIVGASLEAGTEFIFVEQEDMMGQDPYACIARSHQNLVSLGFGELFERQSELDTIVSSASQLQLSSSQVTRRQEGPKL